MRVLYKKMEGPEISHQVGGFGKEFLSGVEIRDTQVEEKRAELLALLSKNFRDFYEEQIKDGKYDGTMVTPAEVDFIRSGKGEEKIEKAVADILNKISSTIKEYLTTVQSSDSSADEALEFLSGLIVNDKMDDTTMPAIFCLPPEFPVHDVTYYATYQEHSDSDDNRTYRSLLYSVIIEQLKLCGAQAVPYISKIIKNIESLHYLDADRKYKVGYEITTEQFRAEVVEKNERDAELIRQGKLTIFQDDLGWMGEMDLEENRFLDSRDYNMGLSFEKFEMGRPLKECLKVLAELKAGESAKIQEQVLEVLLAHIYESSEIVDSCLEIFNQKPGTAGGRLLDHLRNSPDDIVKSFVTRLLYRLELGKIGLLEKGVQYLDKVFDIGKKIEAAAFAHRATADGKVAVFDNKNRALGYFQLIGLDSPEQIIKAEFLEFTYDTLFYQKPKETPGERAEREQILEDFKQHYFSTYLSGDFYRETKTHFNNLSFKEQGWFLWYVQHAELLERARAMEFIRKYGENGLRTFISLEHDKSAGDKIVALGTELPKDVADKLFQKYAQIVDTATSVGKELQSRFNFEDNAGSVTANIIDNLLKQAKNLLIESHSNLLEIVKNKAAIISLEKKLAALKADLILFAATFKNIATEQEINLETIVNASVEKIATLALSASDKLTMTDIFIQNRPGYTPELLEQTKKDFAEILNDPKKEFYILRVSDEIVAFIRFDKLDEQTLYAGSLNVRTEMRGSAIGSAFFKTTLDKAAERHNVIADVYERNPMLKHYIADFGFKAVGEDTNYHNSGQRFIKIERASLKQTRSHAQAA